MKNFWLNRRKKREVTNVMQAVIIKKLRDQLKRKLAWPKRCGCTKVKHKDQYEQNR